MITKLPSFKGNFRDIQAVVRSQIKNSLRNLRQPRLAGLLLHRPVELLSAYGPAIWCALNSAKDEGLIESIGYSIYSPNELNDIYKSYPPDIVQTPYNILDRRICSSGWMDKLYSDGVEIHVRSVFLQGLLLMEYATRPPKFDEWSSLWQRWENWLDNSNVTKLQGALQFAMSNQKVTKIVVGVDSVIQLKGIIEAAESRVISEFPSELSCDSQRLINPGNWGAL